jgi:predicted amino acid dehydrogenase
MCFSLTFLYSSLTFAHCPLTYPVECDGWCCPAGTSDCTSAILEEICIEEDDDQQPCISKTIYGENFFEVEYLRYVRDNILIHTSEGQEIIRLYYKWTPVLANAIEEDEDLKENVKELIDSILFLIKGGDLTTK